MNPLTQQCSATSKRSRKRCLRLVVGGGVCVMHGGAAKQVATRRRERVELAEALEASPRRHPAEILLDTLHAADLMMRRSIEADAATSPEELGQLVEMIERAQRFARSTLDLDILARQHRTYEQVAGAFVALIEQVLKAADLSPHQQASAHLALVAGLERIARAGDTS